MKVKIYVDWDYREVITSIDEKERIMKGYIEEVEDDRMCHTQEYLEDHCITATEVLIMSNDERENLKKNIDNFIKDLAQDEFNEHYEEIEVEI